MAVGLGYTPRVDRLIAFSIEQKGPNRGSFYFLVVKKLLYIFDQDVSLITEILLAGFFFFWGGGATYTDYVMKSYFLGEIRESKTKKTFSISRMQLRYIS